VIRRFLVIGTLLPVLVGSLCAPTSTLGGDPIPPQELRTEIPPRLPDGPITLPNGRVLPVKPASVKESSVQAEMLAAHDHDKIDFVPGGQPRLLGAPAATVSLAPSTAGRITPLGLAGSGTPADLAATGSLPNGLRKEVLGFLPYWMLDASSLQWMRYQVVSTIAYFGVAARPDGTLAMTSAGSPTAGWNGWNSSAMTNVTNTAHAQGVRVVLTVTMMAWDGGAEQAALLGNATARAQLVTAIVDTVRNRAADGVNLDFEPVSTTLRNQYTSFVRQLKAGLVAAGVGSYLTVCTMASAATWASGYDLAGLTAAGAADAVFVMGYDYSWSGSARAGGVAPMDSAYVLDVGDTVDDYLQIIPGGKIIWGVPYYGRTWLTTSDALNATTVAGASGSSKAYGYIGARNLATTYGRRWDDVGKVPWFVYFDSVKASWVQGYYDDAVSLAEKYDMVNARGLLGTGMWTLLMDQGDSALGDLLKAKFVTPLALAASYSAIPPTTWTGGQAQTYAITVTNTGTQTWNATGTNRVRLGIQFGTSSDNPGEGWSTDQRFGLPADLAPGASVVLNVSVTPPLDPGNYVLRHRMVKEGVGWVAQIQKTNVSVGPPPLAASYSSSPPTAWTGGQSQNYAITLTNTGSQTWSATGTNRVRLGVAFGTSSDSPGVGWATDQRFGLPADLAPGASVTLNLSVTPPAGAGSYVLRHRMVKEGVAWFAQIQKTNVTVATQPALAASYSASPPTAWTGGQSQTYSITVTNTGSQTWNAGGTNRVRLGIHFGTASDVPGTGWATDQRFSLPADVAPGASVTLSVSVTAPLGGGSYVLRHRMVKEGVTWFDQIQKTNVTVAS